MQNLDSVVISLNEQAVRRMLFHNVEGVVEQGQIALCVKILELFIFLHHLTIEYCKKTYCITFENSLLCHFTVPLLTTQKMSQIEGIGCLV